MHIHFKKRDNISRRHSSRHPAKQVLSLSVFIQFGSPLYFFVSHIMSCVIHTFTTDSRCNSNLLASAGSSFDVRTACVRWVSRRVAFYEKHTMYAYYASCLGKTLNVLRTVLNPSFCLGLQIF